MKFAVRPYFPNPLRCFKCQRFGHSQDSCRGTLICARCAEAGHDSSACTKPEKCVNCKDSHTSFSRSCSAWKFEKEVIAEKVKKDISYIEARQIVKSRTPPPGVSYASVVNKTFGTTSTQILSAVLPSDSARFKISYIPSETCPRYDESFIAAFNPSTCGEKTEEMRKSTVSESNISSSDCSGFKKVNNSKKFKKDYRINKDNQKLNISNAPKHYKTSHLSESHKMNLDKKESAKFHKTSPRKPPLSASVEGNSGTNDVTSAALITNSPALVYSADTETRILADLPSGNSSDPLRQESDTDAEMCSSASEGDTLEYMSENLEDTSEDTSPPTPPLPTTYKQTGEKILPYYYSNKI
ncbi:uncharacterized protein LOC129956690 [Argiope bruennichi]|uniref:uncharacterized protein LOC129956690 n=1 Tax=Argiope bruennichi TaxID=94029 RepID=UPI002494DCB4|nr:uncharacterized protein LOC129956690 [Argiope bruennichi]